MATAPEPEKKISWRKANLEKARECARKYYQEKKKDPAFVQAMRDKANERYRKKMKEIDFRYKIRQYNRDYARANRSKTAQIQKYNREYDRKNRSKTALLQKEYTKTEERVERPVGEKECIVKDVQEGVWMSFGGDFRIGK